MDLAVFGDRQTRLPVGGGSETVVSLFADVEVDASAVTGPTALTFVGLAGEVKIHVPAGARVVTSGFSLAGDRSVQVTPVEGPEVVVRVYGAFLDLEVVEWPLSAR